MTTVYKTINYRGKNLYIGFPQEAILTALPEGVLQVPLGWTTSTPPTVSNHQIQVLNIHTGQWDVESDYRGVMYWEQDGTQHLQRDLGGLPDGTLTDHPPSDHHKTHDSTAWILDIESQKEYVKYLKSSKKEMLRLVCETAITAPFQSSALGVQHTYDCRRDDQSNIKMRFDSLEGETNTSTKKIWAHDGSEFIRREHTRAQLLQVIKDMENHIEIQQNTLENKINEVEAINMDESTTYNEAVTAIEAVDW